MLWFLAFIILLSFSSYYQATIHQVALLVGLLLGGYILLNGLTRFSEILWFTYLLIFIPITVPLIRQELISRKLFAWMKKALPTMSKTEREALTAGNTWWDAQLFSGKPDWKYYKIYLSDI